VERGDLTGALLDGRYRVIEPVAEGAMGIIYRAERVKLGRIVAIKVLHDVLPNELSGRKRFEIEAMAMAKLEHPHCASVLDVGVHGDRPFVVMDFVSGQNLKELISRGPLPIPRAAEIVRQVLSGLAHAHEHGIIHRDIKPANIVLSQKVGLGDHVKILDFGLARLADTSQNLTAGLAVGTPAYMAPEQVRGQKLDHRADLYACGVLLFELVTGQKPFQSETDDPIEVCRMQLSAPVPRLDDKLPGTAFGELEAVVAKALAKRAGKRYASAQAFAAALDAATGRPARQVQSPAGPVPAIPARAIAAGEPAASQTSPSALEVSSGAVLSAEPAAFEPGGTSGAEAAARPSRAPERAEPGDDPAQAQPEPVGMFLGIVVPRSPRATTRGGTATPAVGTAAAGASAAGASAAGASAAGASAAGASAAGASAAGASAAGASAAGASAADGAAGASAAATPARAPARRRRRWRIAVGAAIAIAVVGGAVIAMELLEPPPSSAPIAAPVGLARRPDPGQPILQRASELAAQGDREAALELLNRSRRQIPDSAGIPYAAGRLFFAKYFWTEGLKAFRDAIRIDPSYRSDPELLKAALRGFIMTPSYSDDLASFLHDDIGAASRPLLEETSRDHPIPAIRSRAANELRRYR
jgi:serine/threonine-protein kinase